MQDLIMLIEKHIFRLEFQMDAVIALHESIYVNFLSHVIYSLS